MFFLSFLFFLLYPLVLYFTKLSFDLLWFTQILSNIWTLGQYIFIHHNWSSESCQNTRQVYKVLISDVMFLSN